MSPGGAGTVCMIRHMFPALDLYHADPAQPLTTAGEELDDLHNDLFDLSARCWTGGTVGGLPPSSITAVTPLG